MGMPDQEQQQRLVDGLVAGGEGHPEREEHAQAGDQEVTGEHPALHPATAGDQVGELGAGAEKKYGIATVTTDRSTR